MCERGVADKIDPSDEEAAYLNSLSKEERILFEAIAFPEWSLSEKLEFLGAEENLQFLYDDFRDIREKLNKTIPDNSFALRRMRRPSIYPFSLLRTDGQVK